MTENESNKPVEKSFDRAKALTDELSEIASASGPDIKSEIVKTHPNHEYATFLLSSEGKQEILADGKKHLAEPRMQGISELFKAKQEIEKKLDKGEIDWQTYITESSKLTEMHYYTGFDTDVKKYNELQAQLADMERNRVLIVGEQANSLGKKLVETAPNAESTDRAHIFVDSRILGLIDRESYEAGRTLEISLSTPMEVPLGMFVNAASFDSWHGRPTGVMKDGRPSNEVIQDYAGRETQPPPVEASTMYLLPDGRVFFRSENSHRTAAAISRGDEHIQVEGRVRVYVLKDTPKEF